jgi:hypothetical protein
MLVERMDLTSGGAPLTDPFLEDEMFELLAIRRAMPAWAVSQPEDVGRAT